MESYSSKYVPERLLWRTIYTEGEYLYKMWSESEIKEEDAKDVFESDNALTEIWRVVAYGG